MIRETILLLLIFMSPASSHQTCAQKGRRNKDRLVFHVHPVHFQWDLVVEAGNVLDAVVAQQARINHDPECRFVLNVRAALFQDQSFQRRAQYACLGPFWPTELMNVLTAPQASSPLRTNSLQQGVARAVLRELSLQEVALATPEHVDYVQKAPTRWQHPPPVRNVAQENHPLWLVGRVLTSV